MLRQVPPVHLSRQPAPHEDQHPVADLRQFRQVRRRDQYRRAARGQLAHDPVHFGPHADVHAPRRVIKDHDLRVGREPLGEDGLLLVVNNAGVYPSKPFEETTAQELRRVLRVNLEAPSLVMQAALPRLKAAGWGGVVNIASVAVFTAPYTMVPYGASKRGLIGFPRALAPYGITVNAIAPTMVRTTTAERTVGADGGFLTGQTLNVSGGSAYL
jgi:NAD(P)-dependent dehydrogenase (short-subunit alcohol dehydrogenase family)